MLLTPIGLSFKTNFRLKLRQCCACFVAAQTVLGALLTINLLTCQGLAAGPACGDLLRSSPLTATADGLLIKDHFQRVSIRTGSSPGVASRLIEEARILHLNEDFKYLSDLQEKNLTPSEKQQAFKRAKDKSAVAAKEAQQSGRSLAKRKAYVSSLLDELYEFNSELLPAPAELTKAKWQLSYGPKLRRRCVDYIENLGSLLIKRTPVQSQGSIIPVPFPITIPGARFRESYYWDTYFVIQGLLVTKRWDLAAMQIENFLFMIENYALVPNGLRDYYLTRSQPPVLSSMIRDVVVAGLGKGRDQEIKTWLRDRALPLLKKDYHEFWMNPETRFDSKTGLNHHWDEKNTPREERHGADREEQLGETYRDVRSEAESGKDFTEAFDGKTSQVAPVLLNSVLYKVETDIAWIEDLLGNKVGAKTYLRAAQNRQNAINRFLWDPSEKTYRDYNLRSGKQSAIITADIFAALWAKLASHEQAEGVRRQLAHLELAGGLASSTFTSGKQWDAPFGWAPHHYFAIEGLRNYSQMPNATQDALRLAGKWLTTNENIFNTKHALLEKIDASRGAAPIDDGSRYDTPEGFGWTNGIYMWVLVDVLGYRLSPR